MDRAAEKVSIFDTQKTPHEQRFVAFNDMPVNDSKYKKGAETDFKSGDGRYTLPIHPFVIQQNEQCPDYSPNKEKFLKNLRTGNVDFNRQKDRPSFIPEPEFNDPQHFHQPYVMPFQHPMMRKGRLIDQEFSKGVKPKFELLSGRRATDRTYVMMDSTQPRDNKMYRLTDGWNLDKSNTHVGYRIEPHLEQRIVDYQESCRQAVFDNELAISYDEDASFKIGTSLVKDTEQPEQSDVSTASESQFGSKKRGPMMQTLDRQFRRTANENLKEMKQ